MHNTINECRICKNTNLEVIFDLGQQALTGVFPKSEAIDVPKGPLKLVKCSECNLVQLADNYESSMLYGDNYGYRSGLNNSMVIHLRNTVKKILDIVTLQDNDIVVDIGSNDSTLLQNYPKANLNLVGIDPSGTKFKSFYPEHINLISDFFSQNSFRKSYPQGKAKIITSIAMFYDLENPQKFVDEIASILDEEGVWLFEQSYLPFMLSSNSFDTICHEHLEYYALGQIKYMLDAAGLKIIDVEFNDINGGSFTVISSKKSASFKESSQKVQDILLNESNMKLASLGLYTDFKNRIEEQKRNLLDFINAVKAKGESIIGYGASTKGNVLIQYYGLTSSEIPFIAEVNEDKFGAFTPGSKIKIISEEQARAMKPDYLLVFPWHFKNFIIKKEMEFLNNGGKLVFPLPNLEVVSSVEAKLHNLAHTL